MSCPDWSNLARRRDQDGEGELAWERSLAHLDDCERCRQSAYAAEPTLMFRRLPALEPTRQEVEAMKKTVAALRRTQPIVEPAAMAKRYDSRRRSRAAIAMRAAAMVAVVAGAALLYGVMAPGGGLQDSSAKSLLDVFFSVAEETPRELTFEVRVLRASKHELDGPTLAESDPPPKLVEELAKVIRYDNYQVLAEAGVGSAEGQTTASALGDGFEVSFKAGAIEKSKVMVEDFTIERKGGKSGPRVPLLLRTPLHLELDQPSTLIVAQLNQDDLLVVAVTWTSADRRSE